MKKNTLADLVSFNTLYPYTSFTRRIFKHDIVFVVVPQEYKTIHLAPTFYGHQFNMSGPTFQLEGVFRLMCIGIPSGGHIGAMLDTPMAPFHDGVRDTLRNRVLERRQHLLQLMESDLSYADALPSSDTIRALKKN